MLQADRDAAIQNFERAAELIIEGAIHLGAKRDNEVDLYTPSRFSEALFEMLEGYKSDSEMGVRFEESPDMTWVSEIPYTGICAHHLLPFWGKAYITIVPSKRKPRVPGLSKYVRVVQKHAKRLTLQERIAGDVADEIMGVVKPAGVMVIVEGIHGCMTFRGVRADHCSAGSSAIRGILNEPAVRTEALMLSYMRKAK